MTQEIFKPIAVKLSKKYGMLVEETAFFAVSDKKLIGVKDATMGGGESIAILLNEQTGKFFRVVSDKANAKI